MSIEKNDKQLEDILDLDESSLSLANIELIAQGGDERKYFENKYFGDLYSNILLVLTHESYDILSAPLNQLEAQIFYRVKSVG